VDRRLKERLIGAVVLILLAVIFIPMILDNSAQDDIEITGTNIPPVPDMGFRSAIVPLEDLPPVEPPPLPVTELPPADITPTASATSGADTMIEPIVNTPLPVTDSITTPPPAELAVIQRPEPDQVSGSVQIQPADSSPRSMSAWVIQLGSFSSQVNADSLVRRLQNQGFPAYIEQVKAETGTVFKVRVGPELSRTDAENIQKNLKSKMNLDAIIMRFP
jgi:DedD protein